MKAAHINPFLQATINLFRQTFGIVPDVGTPYLVDDFHSHRWEISGVMILTGSAIGVVSLRLSRLLASKLLDKSGVCVDEEDRESIISGMIGELVNVISGNAATVLSGYDIRVSVPFVVQGKDHSISWPDRAPVMGVPFITKYGPFAVYVSLIDLGNGRTAG